jgi:hypothetical protein
MNPKAASLFALCLVAVVGGIVHLSRKAGGETPPPDASALAVGARVVDRAGPSAPARRVVVELSESDEEPSTAWKERSAPSESEEVRTARKQLALVERDRVTSRQLKQASAGFQQTMDHLVADLGLQAGQVPGVAAIFTRREKDLAELLTGTTSRETGKESVKKISGLIRNKGLRAELAGVLSPAQLAAFDAREAQRQRDTVEARAYKDMAEISSALQLTDSQKQKALETLAAKAPEKVELEADARAFLSLTYGPLATEMDSRSIRGLTNLMSQNSHYDPYSEDYRTRAVEMKSDRIEKELSALRDILNDDQLARYRELLEAEPVW